MYYIASFVMCVIPQICVSNYFKNRSLPNCARKTSTPPPRRCNSQIIDVSTPTTSSAATAIVSVNGATGSIHAHLLMSGLLPSSSSGAVISNQPPLNPSANNAIGNSISAPSHPLEVKFESRDEITGETRIIVEDLSLPSIDNVSILEFKTSICYLA